MKKKPIAIIFNDTHLKPENEIGVLESVNHLVRYAVKTGIDKLIFAGDLFDSRSFQRQSVLHTLDKALRTINEAGLTLYIIPGNHDKTLYNSEDSFLDIYRFYPGVKFYKSISKIQIDGIDITLLPFFSDDILVPLLKEAEGGDILISHFEMQGSTNLGRVSAKDNITKKMLKKWKRVYLGHYHNHHEITKEIVHLPSLRQNNFGEDSNKGFSVLYDDLSYEIIKGVFRAFNKVSINIESTTTKDLKDLINLHKNSKDSVRFEFYGEESKVKAIDKSLFKDTGIDVKIKYDTKHNFDADDLIKPEVVKKHNKETVKEAFGRFCEEKGYNYEEGLVFLNNFLNK